MAKPVTRPNRELAANKRAKYVDTGEASRMLDGLISAGVLRQMCLNGEIRGAIKVRTRVLIPRFVVPTLIQELDHSLTPTYPTNIPIRRVAS
ncbi:MAG TPA: hypothetical protein VGJ60_11235 [Chloroflexota bacterium]|jgi:hypothetical protein